MTQNKFIKTLSNVKQSIAKMFQKGLTKNEVTKAVIKQRKAKPNVVPNIKKQVTLTYDILQKNGFITMRQNIVELLSNGMKPEQVVETIVKQGNVKPNVIPNIKKWVTISQQSLKKQNVKKKIIKKQKEEIKSFADTPQKELIRQAIIDRIKSSPTEIQNGLFLTLSWWKCITEIQLNKLFPNLKFLSCESNELIYKKLCKFIKQKKLTFMEPPRYTKVGTVIHEMKTDSLSGALLDYCGCLPTFKKEIQFLFSKKIVKINGIIWLTFAARGYEKGFCAESELHNLVKPYLKNYEWEVEPIKYHDKNQGKKGMEMITCVLRRIK